jgi:hypothetical protein
MSPLMCDQEAAFSARRRDHHARRHADYKRHAADPSGSDQILPNYGHAGAQKNPGKNRGLKCSTKLKMAGQDSNLRPRGYEFDRTILITSLFDDSLLVDRANATRAAPLDNVIALA